MAAPGLLDIARRLLTTGNLLERWARYLAAYKVIEGNLALFDKLARCRDLREFQDAIYEAARVKDRVLEKLSDGVRRKEIVITSQRRPEEFTVDNGDLKVLMEIATENEQAPRVVGSMIASFALLHGEVRRA